MSARSTPAVNPSRGLLVRLLALVLLSPGAVADAPSTAPAGAATPDLPSDTWADVARDAVAGYLDATANWFDAFFGTASVPATTEASAYLQLIMDGFYSGVPDENHSRIRVRGGADLPRFEDRLRLILTTDADAAVTGRDLTGIEADYVERRDEPGGVGLRYLFRDDRRHQFGLGGGVSGGSSPELLVNARYRYTHSIGPRSAARLTPTIYWKSRRGFGASAVAELQYLPRPDTLWRYTLFGNYRYDEDDLQWSTEGSWWNRLDPKSALSTRVGAKGETLDDEVLTEVWTTVRYRRNIWRPWLFYEIEPGVSWHEKVDYRIEPTVAVRLDIQFYRN